MPDSNSRLSILAYEKLKSMIENNDLSPDEIYSEARIAQHFGISRTPIREALIRLSNNRYIDVLPNRGFRIHKSTLEDVHISYHIRSCLEKYCAEKLIDSIDSDRARETLKNLRSLFQMQLDMPTILTRDELTKFWQLDEKFHIALIEYLDILQFLDQYSYAIHFYIAVSWPEYTQVQRNVSSIEEHRAILEALENGDKEAAIKAISYHIDRSTGMTESAILRRMETEKGIDLTSASIDPSFL